ncbi:MAG: fibronectin type III domain-containing protein, partial [Planctomycetota bacterium]
YNVQPQQVTTDAELVPSLIKFSTDGSPVLILYKAGCCEPDPVRPTRTGGRGILNAFELVQVVGGPDTNPPTPDPATFDSPPAAVSSSEITMTATTGSDASPPVEYYFDETSLNPGGSDSGWVTNPVYNDTGLNPDTQYTYTVQMRDSLGNTGTVSAPAGATTPPDDVDPPTPDPATFASPPAAVSQTEITMTATTGSDASPPVEYYFDETSLNPGGSDSGWTTNPVYNDTGLDPGTQYTYTVQMRDSLGNTGTVSAPASATTPQETDPPTPDPATFASPPAAVSQTEITMTATTGSDASPPVEYFFDETSLNPGGSDSGWTTNPVYNDTGLNPGTQYTYTVQMRDSLGNTGTVSAPASATTPQETDPPTPDPATFDSPPAAVSSTEITMTATTGSDASPPVEYYFAETSGNPGGSDSGWTTNPVYNDTGLNPETQYTYTVQMRDSLGNTGTVSAPASATTPPSCVPANTHVESIVCDTLPGSKGNVKYGRATVTIYDNCGNPVVGADVTGTFTGDFSEQLTETTDGNGVAVFVTSTEAKKPAYTFCVDAVAHASLTYDSNANVETCDSYQW